MTMRPSGLAVLLIGLVLFAIPAGEVSPHSHPEGTGKTCTLCYSLHLPGSFATVPGLSRPIVRPEPVFVLETPWICPALSSSLCSRGPPSVPAAS
ncbi:MAG TPA: hypothetical protein VGD06_06330 [Acidobacteriota bacterium]|jgi:hypothetical protein